MPSDGAKLKSLALKLGLVETSRNNEDIQSIKIENCIGFSKVPVGLAGPVHIVGPDVNGTLYAPLATCEPTLVASCSRGCKAFNRSGGLRFDILGDGMSRAPVFAFQDPGRAVAFYRSVPAFQAEFAAWAKTTSRFVQLTEMRPAIIGSNVHLFCHYTCGDASGQNMVTKATSYACSQLRKKYADKFAMTDFYLEGQLASDKKPSWGNVNAARGVQVLAWGKITSASCKEVLGLTMERLYDLYKVGQDGGLRNGLFGSNINTANIIAAMYISTGQDAGSVAESSWSHLTMEFDKSDEGLIVSLFFPSLTVGTVGGGTAYSTQRETLRALGCLGSNKKNALAGIIASFALALDVSTLAAIANDTFTDAHMRLARGENYGKL
ncbi:unnamed protein product [Clonostachys byssicola]|uniref:hydroxymethylglutaryl-CoA reductase (NADPH) n=1 Tax=Clonostachys byssicola TaxID=160290 RepID=A0A9N9Y2D0_9HYPO|nr:unnamed protein product [Clonostachys byssicola]